MTLYLFKDAPVNPEAPYFLGSSMDANGLYFRAGKSILYLHSPTYFRTGEEAREAAAASPQRFIVSPLHGCIDIGKGENA